MTRHELHHILETPSFDERRKMGLPVFEWEHCAKSLFHYYGVLVVAKYYKNGEAIANGIKLDIWYLCVH